jgi:pyridoxine 5-phosphate synthase
LTVRRLVLILDTFPILRAAAAANDIDVTAAATMAELSDVDAVRLGVNEELLPVTEQDVGDARRAARSFELAMPVSQPLVKIALEAQPDRAVLGAIGREGGLPNQPLDLHGRGISLAPIVRSLGDAGIPVTALVKPEIEAVKAAHAEGVDGVEFYTGAIVDLPSSDRARKLEALGDAARLASKLRMHISVGGGLGYRGVGEVIEHAPVVSSIAVGRSVFARALLVGVERAVRDLRARLT